MAETISTQDANHDFARLLRDVEAGQEFVITRDGSPVARLVPERESERYRQLTPAQEEALQRSIARLRRGWPLGIERLDRNELYDEVIAERGKRPQ